MPIESNRVSSGTPSVASLAWLNSTKMRSRLVAVEIDLGDVGNALQTFAKRLGDILQLGVRGAVADDRVENRIDVAELVVDEGAETPLGKSGKRSLIFLRSCKNRSGTSRGGVESRKFSEIAVKDGLE